MFSYSLLSMFYIEFTILLTAIECRSGDKLRACLNGGNPHNNEHPIIYWG